MKKLYGIVAAVTLVIAMAGGAMAATSTTNDVTVTATVLGVCYFDSAASSITFANIDPSSASAATANTTLNYACTTNAAAPTLTQDIGTSGCAGATSGALGGALYMAAGGACMKYTLGSSALSSTGFSAYNTATITATIAVADFQNMPASAAYTDTVQLTINY